MATLYRRHSWYRHVSLFLVCALHVVVFKLELCIVALFLSHCDSGATAAEKESHFEQANRASVVFQAEHSIDQRRGHDPRDLAVEGTASTEQRCGHCDQEQRDRDHLRIQTRRDRDVVRPSEGSRSRTWSSTRLCDADRAVESLRLQICKDRRSARSSSRRVASLRGLEERDDESHLL